MKNPWSMAEPISRPRAGYVDFSIVPERHQEMHARLENWGRSRCTPSSLPCAGPDGRVVRRERGRMTALRWKARGL